MFPIPQAPNTLTNGYRLWKVVRFFDATLEHSRALSQTDANPSCHNTLPPGL